MSQNTVTINGTVYDTRTGLPLATLPQDTTTNATTVPSEVRHSGAIHQTVQKSQTLNRQVVHKTTQPPKNQTTQSGASTHAITKFAPHPAGAKKPKMISDIGPVSHPMMAKATQHLQPSTQTPKATLKSSHLVKQEAITEALRKAPDHGATTHQVKKSKRHPRLVSILSGSLALVLLGGYFTYLNMPNLSVRVAAAQAGVNATYPEYRPDGYSLRGPVAYSKGEVSIKFAANGGPQNFTVTQTKSTWDSSAVLDNYIKEKAGDNYITYSERGLTIYTYDGNAAWVNGGIFYTITGDAPLSSDQIRRVATSM